MRRFDLAVPGSVDDCLKALAGNPAGAKLVAGGTDLLPQMKNGLLKPAQVVDLSGVAELRVLAADGSGLRIGAAVTARWSVPRTRCTSATASAVGSPSRARARSVTATR